MKYIPITFIPIILLLSGCSQSPPVEGEEITFSPKDQQEWKVAIQTLRKKQEQCYIKLSDKDKKLVDDAKRRIDLCVTHIQELGVAMCEFKHAHGRWPNEEDLYEYGILKDGEKFVTLEGAPITFDAETSDLGASCVHPKVPFIPTSPNIGYYNGTSGHGLGLNQKYKNMYDQ